MRFRCPGITALARPSEQRDDIGTADLSRSGYIDSPAHDAHERTRTVFGALGPGSNIAAVPPLAGYAAG